MDTDPDPTGVPTRDRVSVDETWDLTAIYPDEAAWDTDADRLPDLIERAVAHRGTLGSSPAALAQALDDAMAARQVLGRLHAYASLRHDEDTTEPQSAARFQRVEALRTSVEHALAFLEPDLLALPEERLEALLSDPVLTRYGHWLDNLRRRRPHVRSAEVEELLAHAGEVTRSPLEAYQALDDADLAYGRVADETGAEVELTYERYIRLSRSPDRAVRRRAYEAMTGSYLAHRHIFAALLAASVRTDVYLARARNYPSARAAALFADAVPEAVYDTLIETVGAARPTVARYLDLRRRALGLDALAFYDQFVPLAPLPERQYAYREAVAVVLAALRPLGERYVVDLGSGFTARWVDVHETRGKRSGAYSAEMYGAAPPRILLNWNGTLPHVYTLAHEAGHAMHTFYANAAQPFHDARYPTFLAEIAAMVNEVLLTRHLLAEASPGDGAAHFGFLTSWTERLFTVLVGMTVFADFEHTSHALAEAGKPLTLEVLTTS